MRYPRIPSMRNLRGGLLGGRFDSCRVLQNDASVGVVREVGRMKCREGAGERET